MNDLIPPMPSLPPRRPGNGWWFMWIVYVSAIVMSTAMVVGGRRNGSELFMAAGMLAFVVVVAIGPVVYIMSRRFATGQDEAMAGHLERLAAMIEKSQEFSALSDDARRTLNRRRERELLCGAIEEDMAAEDWDAAMVLVNELAHRFGYRADAEGFRQRIDAARAETMERKLKDAIALLDGLIIQRRWDQAHAEAARIARLYPDSSRSESLKRRVEQAHASFKDDLERRFLTAAKEERVGDAMSLLKELDAYLSPQDAERYREVARGVIGKARDNLGAEFKLAIQDRRWRKAVEVGERIVEQFPNSRMADEVRAMIDGLRSKAAAPVG